MAHPNNSSKRKVAKLYLKTLSRWPCRPWPACTEMPERVTSPEIDCLRWLFWLDLCPIYECFSQSSVPRTISLYTHTPFSSFPNPAPQIAFYRKTRPMDLKKHKMRTSSTPTHLTQGHLTHAHICTLANEQTHISTHIMTCKYVCI